MDKTLINTLKKLASKEKNIKEFKKRLRIKGRVSKKELTKKGNIKLSVQYKEDKYPIIILKSHKETYALAEKVSVGTPVSVQAIPQFRMNICTQIKMIQKYDESTQSDLSQFS